ncbi:dethiobiotin synthase [Salinarchaeum chitinilyticum]
MTDASSDAVADAVASIRDGSGAFVAGTDTGVGKTIFTAGLTGWLREEGVDARAIKPAQTGAPADDDAAVVAAAADDATEASTCLRRLGPALAPRVAAEREGVELDYDDLLADCRGAVESTVFPIVEGIGGLRVPLAGDREVLDLAADLGLPAIVVARSGLGTLNHTALTVDALRSRDIAVPLVILNEYEPDGVAERTNPAELRRMLDVPVATLPPFDATDPDAIVPALRTVLEPDAAASGTSR